MEIRLRNIQSFRDVRYSFPDTGLVQIIGENSNGKSILGKVLTAIAEMKFTIQEERDPLIRDGEEWGSVAIEYKHKGLLVFLHRQRNQCYVKLLRENGEDVTRSIREGGIDMLLEEFGFRVYGKRSIVLQIHETMGAVPFVNTPSSMNFEIVDAVTTDTIAQQFLLNFKEITHKRAKELLKEYSAKIESYQRVKESLVMYDYVAYQEAHDKMAAVYAVLKCLEPIELKEVAVLQPVVLLGLPELLIEEIDVVPDVKLLGLEEIKVCEVSIPPTVKFIGKPEPVSSIYQAVKDLSEIVNGRCPFCGRPLVGQCRHTWQEADI